MSVVLAALPRPLTCPPQTPDVVRRGDVVTYIGKLHKGDRADTLHHLLIASWSGDPDHQAVLMDEQCRTCKRFLDSCRVDDLPRAEMWHRRLILRDLLKTKQGKEAILRARQRPSAVTLRNGRTISVNADYGVPPSQGAGYLESWQVPLKTAQSIEHPTEWHPQFARYLSFWTARHQQILVRLGNRHPQQLRVYVEVRQNGKTLAAIAREMGQSPDTVKSWYRRARQFVRAQLRSDEESEWARQDKP